MTDSFPRFDSLSLVAESEVVGGDAYYTGDKRIEYIQPDSGNDGGYWESSDIPDTFSTPVMDQILARLEVLEEEIRVLKNP